MRSVAVFFLIVTCVFAEGKGNGILPVLEGKLENKFAEYAGGVTKWLEGFNDEHLGNTELGRFLHYEDIKTKLEENFKEENEGRSMKKMGMAMMPLIFHIGATSTWMLITTVLTAKSLAVGLMLLIFKIAVSSAKLAAFFTHLKGKHAEHHGHHDWGWTPHFEHHDPHLDHHPEHHGTISHIPELVHDIPHSFHEFKNNEIHEIKPEFNFQPHEFHEYKTIPEMPMLPGFHEMHGFDGFNHYSNDFNHFEGAKKKIDTKVG